MKKPGKLSAVLNTLGDMIGVDDDAKKWRCCLPIKIGIPVSNASGNEASREPTNSNFSQPLPKT